MIIIGENEEKKNCIAVRKHGGEDLGQMSVNDFIKLINTSINKILNN
jgi:threonyl-tRNA synthetase